MPKKLTTAEFIEQVSRVHGGKYDYSKVVYKNDSEKVAITCPKHGDFDQKATNHKQGAGCPSCWAERKGKDRRIGNDEFIRRSADVHGGKYDYSKVEYLHVHAKVTITCPIHGDFLQTPSGHLSGKGCISCAGSKKLTCSEFIEKAQLIHGRKYDYSRVEYINIDTPVEILCERHGAYIQSPYKHLDGQRCPECGRESLAEQFKRSTDDFIIEARKIHGQRYDYSQVDYVNAHTSIKIICPDHGLFWQSPNSHIRHSGCPSCENPLRGEQMIADALDGHGIFYYRQVSFSGCQDVRPLWFDFYLPTKNMLIEFDGKQHFQPISWFGGDEAFEGMQRRDRIKDDFAISRGFRLARLTYKDMESRRLKDILECHLFSLAN
jgi:very-short-patch-repair endonuclease